MQATPSLLAPLVRGGTLVQVTAASLDGRLGTASRNTGHRLVAAGLAHMVASDAHGSRVREAGMRAAVGAIRDDALARWLVSDVPNAIASRYRPASAAALELDRARIEGLELGDTPLPQEWGLHLRPPEA